LIPAKKVSQPDISTQWKTSVQLAPNLIEFLYDIPEGQMVSREVDRIAGVLGQGLPFVGFDSDDSQA
jgi:hypothetical protein